MPDLLQPSRRGFVVTSAIASSNLLMRHSAGSTASEFRFKYILGGCMYGYTKLAEILPEVKKINATAIDIWPKPHGDQCEQLGDMGESAFADLLRDNHVSLGCITQYKLGPFGLQNEMRRAKRLGCKTMVTGGKGPAGLTGSELKSAVSKFVEQMKPHLAVAAESDVTIAIENHANNLIDSADSLKWLAEMRPNKHLGIAFAPYHLPQNENMISNLIRDLAGSISVFYAWEHGMGCMKKLPKQQELMQMPGRGKLDFAPLVSALKSISFRGWTEIFMHPVPRGIPILESTAAVTAEINRSRQYLDRLI